MPPKNFRAAVAALMLKLPLAHAACDLRFVGVRHGPQDYEVTQAIQREIKAGTAIMGAEGISFGDPEVSKIHGDKIQGIEDGDRSMFSGLVLNYGFMALKMPGREIDARFNLLVQLRTNPLFKSVLLGEKSGVAALSNEVKSTPAYKLLALVASPRLSLQEAAELFQSQMNSQPNSYPTSDWMKISKEAAIRLLPSFNHPLIKHDKIVEFLEHPESGEGARYITQDLDLKWRNEAIFENMKKIADHGCKQKKRVYLMIGAGHLDELRQPLMSIGAKEMSPSEFGMPGPRFIMPDFQMPPPTAK